MTSRSHHEKRFVEQEGFAKNELLANRRAHLKGKVVVFVVVVEEEEGVPLICIRFVNEGVRITRLSEGDLRH
jgi:hypothetical protein